MSFRGTSALEIERWAMDEEFLEQAVIAAADLKMYGAKEQYQMWKAAAGERPRAVPQAGAGTELGDPSLFLALENAVREGWQFVTAHGPTIVDGVLGAVIKAAITRVMKPGADRDTEAMSKEIEARILAKLAEGRKSEQPNSTAGETTAAPSEEEKKP